MVQNVLLVWLDNNIDENNIDCRNTLSQLRGVVNTINTFIDGDQCIHFVNTITENNAYMIISGSLGQDIVPRIHDMFQVDSIFIFCNNKKSHEQWAKEWSEIKDVFTDISLICEALKKSAKQCEQNSISISFMATDDDVSKKNLDHLDPSFMYSQILKEILLTIEFQRQHIKEFINYFRDAFSNNDKELTNIKKFKREYYDQTPIWWYSYESFLYPMLNLALRRMDVDIIIKMGFFVNDLHRHIKQLHSEQFNRDNVNNSFTLYRWQGLSKTDFELMIKTKGGLLSFNNFLSTSKDRDVSLNFADHARNNPDSVGIIFVMTIDPSKSTIPFAPINDVSYFRGQEAEVLFSMNTVFRILEIQPIGEHDRLFQVDLKLIDDNDKDLRVLTDRIRETTFPDTTGWYRLGSLLLQMGQFEKVQKILEVLLEETTDESDKGNIYHQIAYANDLQGEYKVVIRFYKKNS